MPHFEEQRINDIFDRVMNNEFKTDTLYIEKIYERIRAFNNVETTRETIKLSTNVLQQGETFLKFGRSGKPHKRFVYSSDDEQNIFWCKLSEGNNRRSRIRQIKCEDIIDIRVGCNTTTILKHYKIPIEFDDLVFSIVTKMRSLDLQATNTETRNRWVKFLKIMLQENEAKQKENKNNNSSDLNERKMKIKSDLEEIWENDIMTNFSQHWDYQNHCPKQS